VLCGVSAVTVELLLGLVLLLLTVSIRRLHLVLGKKGIDVCGTNICFWFD
jgi:hypothetical protein